ncbi:MAG: MBL fold metallo-hydrolase [Hydrogenoanaerobacterium sp.]
MARFFTIASGSSGNSSYVGSSEAGILVDAGISCKGIMAGLLQSGVEPQQIHGIFITHEHIDHVRGLRVLLQKLSVPVYASEEVLSFLLAQGSVPPGTKLMPMTNKAVQVADMEISCFDTPHDSVHSLGYRIHTSDDRLVGFTGDLGYISDDVQKGISGCDLILMESNYEHNMLMNGAYPYHLKKRICGQNGHLSNEDCSSFLPQLVRCGTTRFVLAHLSKENNSPELAYGAAIAGLHEQKMTESQDFTLTVANRSTAGELLVL